MAINDFAELAKKYEKQIAELENRINSLEGSDEEEYSKEGMLFDDAEEIDEECECGEEDCPICCDEEEISERDELENGGWKSDLVVMEEDEFEPDEDGEYDEDLASGVDLGIPQDVFIGYTDRGRPGRILDSGAGLYRERMKGKK